MLSKKEYKKISAKWDGKVYQKWRRLKERMPMFVDSIEYFKNAKVLELGSNACMYTIYLSPVISKYIGIETSKNYHKQALRTVANLKVPTTLINGKFEDVDLSSLDYDLFLASYVLHHLNEKEVEKLNIVFKKCKKVAIHTRSGDPLKYGHDEIGFDPIPKWNNSKIKKMLDSYGYISEIHLCGKEDYNGIYLILAEKHGDY